MELSIIIATELSEWREAELNFERAKVNRVSEGEREGLRIKLNGAIIFRWKPIHQLSLRTSSRDRQTERGGVCEAGCIGKKARG